MTTPTPSAQRLTQIEHSKAEAARLLATATHVSIKDQVRIATRDLNEALQWLRQKDIDERPFILEIVDLNIQFAANRLAMVDKAIRTYGPDVMLFG